MAYSIITGTGSYIPTVKVANSHFTNHTFYDPQGRPLDTPNPEIIRNFEEITSIKERRYVPPHLNTSDIAFMAAEKALEGVDKETLDFIIVSQNLGDVRAGRDGFDMVPTIAARVKHKLKIENPYTVAYDIAFGCAGWLQGIILADYYIKSGDAKRILVVGAETPSRVSDPHDRDSRIYADGAGAALVEASDREAGILSHVTRSDTLKEAYLLRLGKSYHPDSRGDRLFIKMRGHDIYKYALKTVPEVIRRSLERSGESLADVKIVLMHQANQKLDEAILKRLFKLYKIDQIPEHMMPMTISWLGNSWVATLPTLFDLLLREKLSDHRVRSADIILFASVGVGMNVNSVVYRMP
jgi:3-oxoacyl-[acyl-carrier-protein] synthase-3